jgi:hypothetical protein
MGSSATLIWLTTILIRITPIRIGKRSRRTAVARTALEVTDK